MAEKTMTMQGMCESLYQTATAMTTSIEIAEKVAEEVNEVFPELVNKNEDGEVTAMSYSRMTAVLLEAVKELSQEVKDSREEIRELKKLNDAIKKKFEPLNELDADHDDLVDKLNILING